MAAVGGQVTGGMAGDVRRLTLAFRCCSDGVDDDSVERIKDGLCLRQGVHKDYTCEHRCSNRQGGHHRLVSATYDVGDQSVVGYDSSADMMAKSVAEKACRQRQCLLGVAAVMAIEN